MLPGGAGGGSGAPLGRVPRGTRVPPRGRLLAPPTHPVRWPGQGTHSAGGKSDVFPEGLGQGHQECGPAESRARLSCHGPGRPWQSCCRFPRSLGPKDLSGAGHAAAAGPALRDSRPPGAPALRGLPASSPAAWCPPRSSSSPSSELPAPAAAPLNRSPSLRLSRHQVPAGGLPRQLSRLLPDAHQLPRRQLPGVSGLLRRHDR